MRLLMRLLMIGFILRLDAKMIRFAVGFLLVFGAVGGLDAGESVLACVAVACVGLGLMAWALPKIRGRM